MKIKLRSVVGERGKWSGGRREASSGTKPERSARRRAADGSPPLLAVHCGCPLVTSARSGQARRAKRDERSPVSLTGTRVGHGISNRSGTEMLLMPVFPLAETFFPTGIFDPT